MTFPVTSPDMAESRRYRWLSFLIVLMAVLALSIGAFLLRYVEHRLLTASGETLMLAATEVSDKVDRLLFERHGDVQLMAQVVALMSSDRSRLTDYLDRVKTAYAPFYAWIGVTDARGRMMASTNEALVGRSFGQREWFQAARARGGVIAGDVAVDETDDGTETVAFTAPVLDSHGRFWGVVTARMAVDTIEAVTTRTIRALERRGDFVGSVEYQLLARSGAVFVDSAFDRTSAVNLRTMNLPSALASVDGSPGYLEEDHLRRHVRVVTGYASSRGFGSVPGFAWTVLMRLDQDDVLQPIRSVLWKVGAAVSVVWFPLLLLLLWSTARLRAEYRQAQQESAWARAAEAALLQSQERNRAIVDTAMDGVITIDAAGIVTDWNAQAAGIFGWSREEALGQPLAELIVPHRDRESHTRGIREFLKTGTGPILNRRIEIMALHKDGHELPVEVSVSPARIGEAYIFSAFIRDITERRRNERRLASQYAVTRVLSESDDLEGAVSRIIHAVGESLEWDVGVFWRVDRTSGTLRCLDQWKSDTAEIGEFTAATWQYTFQPGVGLPGRIWQKGEPVWVRDVVGDPDFPRAEVAQRVGLHSAFGFPIRIAGEVEGVIEFFSRQVRDPDGDLLNMVADVGLKIGQFGERTRAQDALQLTEAQLRQSQKMEAVGRLAGGVAHDFNNLLTVIRGYSELILSRLTPDDPMRREMDEVKKAADRAAGLTGQLLAFSRRQFVSTKVVDLNAVVMNMDGMLRRLLGEDIIELCTELDQHLSSIKADPGQIEQVIMNLAVNARDAMPTGGRLTIETSNVLIGKGPHLDAVALEEGAYVLLAVKDTGQGMSEEIQSHLFEPFFTTKEKGKGTGLGLSTVYGIVKQSGGTIGVESKPGRGTTFKIFFPSVGETAKDTETVGAADSQVYGRETILLVEDEPAVRGLVHEALRLHGYSVLVARHGIEALLTGAKHMGPIHLLLTDVVMPQMSGPEVAERLTAVRPDLKVLYMSGYPDHPVFSQGGVKRETAFLQKPFTPNVLTSKVREVLDGVKVA